MVQWRVKSSLFYTTETIGQSQDGDDINKYKAMNCYQVLKHICEAWGMRLVYWRNAYYFIQINQYRIGQTGSQASPDDITNWVYDLEATAISTDDSIQNKSGMYQLYLSNSQTIPTVRWNKLAGGQYGILPAFKQVTVDFLNVSNTNLFTQFPRIPDNPSPAVSTLTYLYNFEQLATLTFDGINDQSFFQRINLIIHNPSIYSGNFIVKWGMFARPAGSGSNTPGASPYVNGWTLCMYPSSFGGYGCTWVAVSASNGFSFTSDFWITPGTQTEEITANTQYNAGQYPVFMASLSGTPKFTAGDWEVCYYVRSSCAPSSAGTGSMANGDWQRHGMFMPSGFSSASTNPHDYNVSYTDSTTTQGVGASEFAPIVNGAVGPQMTQTNMVQTGDDTAHETITNVLFGDTGNNQEEGTVQIYTGSAWQPSDFAGAWGIDTLSGGNSLAQQLASDVFQSQARTLHQFNVSAVLDPGLNLFVSDGTAYIPHYASPLTKWLTPTHSASYTLAKAWIMHTAEFDILNDTWKFNLYQQKNWGVSTTTSTNSTNGTNSGSTGGVGSGAITNAVLGYAMPYTGVSASMARLIGTNLEPVASIRVASLISVTADPVEQTITSLSVGKLKTAIFKIGDIIILQTASRSLEFPALSEYLPAPTNRIKFTISANQSAGDNTLSVTSKTIYQDINIGDTISLDTEDLFEQYNRKTRGTVGGFTVDADGLTKDGIEIIGWTDSNTMEGDDLNQKLPTSESVKAYVDTQVTSIPKGLEYQGTWNATTNTPPIASSTGTAGNYYIVATAGTTTIDGISDWKISDWIIFSSTGVWQKIDQSEGDTLQTVTERGNTTDKQIKVDRDGLAFTADSGTENKIAVFKSTDNKGYITLSDVDTDAYFVVDDDTFFIGPNISTSRFKVDLSTGDITDIGTVDGVDIPTRDAVLTSTTTKANDNETAIALKAPIATPEFTDNIQITGNTGDTSVILFNSATNHKWVYQQTSSGGFQIGYASSEEGAISAFMGINRTTGDITFVGDDGLGANINGINILNLAPKASPTFTGTIAIPNIADLETAVSDNTAKTGITTAQTDKLGFITITEARDIDSMAGDITTNANGVALNVTGLGNKVGKGGSTMTGNLILDDGVVDADSPKVKFVGNDADGSTTYNGQILVTKTGEWQFKYGGNTRFLINTDGDCKVEKDLIVDDNIVVNGTVDGVDIASRDAILTSTTTKANDNETAIATKQNTITLTTEGTSGTSTFNSGSGALNIPEYDTATHIKSVILGVSASQTISTTNVGSKTSYTLMSFTEALGGITVASPYSLGALGKVNITANGIYQVNFSLATQVATTENRTLASGMLFKESNLSEGEQDIQGTQVFNYDRGTETSGGSSTYGSVFNGSGSTSTIFRVSSIGTGGVTYMGVWAGVWIEGRASSSSAIKTLEDGCSLSIIQLKAD